MRHAGAGCLAAAVIAATLYAVTLAPTVGAGDSAELVLAASGLGIPHPPGYALWLLLARLAALIPAGALALRVNALSALSTAVAVGLFWLLARRSGQRTASRVVATALFATASVVWASAVEAEVYGIATAAFLLLALLAHRARRARGTMRDEALFCFAAGLATVAHQTLLFPALVLGAWILARAERGARTGAERKRGGTVAGRIARGLGWAALGVSMTLVIPVRSSAGPSFAWTDVHGLPGLADYLLRRTYGGLAQNPFRLDRAVDQAAGMGMLVAAALGWLGGALAVAGMVASSRARRTLGPVLAAALSIPAALMLLLAFRPDAEHLAQIAPFLAPAVAAAALFAGSGAELLMRRTPVRWRSLAAGALVLGALAWIPARYAEADRSRFHLAEQYGRDLLALAPRGATLILDGDNETFLTAYASRHEGVRPDVALEHRRGWIFGDRYGLRGRPRSEWAEVAHNAEVQRIRSGAGPICYPIPPADLLGTGIPFTQRGLMYEAGAPGAAGAASATPADWKLPVSWPRSSDLLDGHPERYDYVARKMAVAYSDAAARWHWSRGRLGDALPWFQDAARVGFDFPGAHLNYATAAAAVGQPEVALTELLTACRLAPYDPEPPARLAIFLAAAGRPRDAALWFERAFKAEPGAALAADAARAWKRAGDPARAGEWTRRASAGGPG
jgi:tetratricopeptide (TPR) repeat protein